MPDLAASSSWSVIVSIAFGSSVLGTLAGKMLDRSGARTETVRAGYADAVKAMNAWGQYPERIYRRVDDTKETLARLESLGAELKAALAFATGWVSGESAELGQVYNSFIELLRAEVTVHARQAWSSAPASTSAAMNIGGPRQANEIAIRADGIVPAEWLIVQLFSTLIHYRVGWRRLVWVRPLLRRRLVRLRIVEQAEQAFSYRSA